MGHRFSRTTIAKLLAECDILDEKPYLWLVYGEGFRDALNGALDDISIAERRVAQLRGSGTQNRFGQQMTVRGRQQKLKEHVWRDRVHICQLCGMLLEWEFAHPHHIIQVKDGGDDNDSNVLLLCAVCHDKQHIGNRHLKPDASSVSIK